MSDLESSLRLFPWRENIFAAVDAMKAQRFRIWKVIDSSFFLLPPKKKRDGRVLLPACHPIALLKGTWT